MRYGRPDLSPGSGPATPTSRKPPPPLPSRLLPPSRIVCACGRKLGDWSPGEVPGSQWSARCGGCRHPWAVGTDLLHREYATGARVIRLPLRR